MVLMRISFSPQRRDGVLALEQTSVDRLRVNGDLFNFSTLPDGASLPAGTVPCDWIAGPVERVGGEVRLTLILPHGPNPSPAVAFPEPVIVTEIGPIAVPHDEEPADVDA
jgi:hypothetical protein